MTTVTGARAFRLRTIIAENSERQERAAKQRKAAEKKRRAAEEQSKQKAGKKRSAKPRNPYRFKQLEEAIIKLEGEREKLMAALATEEVYRDPEALKEAQFKLAEVERDLEQKNLEWEHWV